MFLRHGDASLILKTPIEKKKINLWATLQRLSIEITLGLQRNYTGPSEFIATDGTENGGGYAAIGFPYTSGCIYASFNQI